MSSPGEFRRVLQGYFPGTDIRLGRLRDGEHERRPGVDITLSAPKSVSLEALLGGPGAARAMLRARCGGAGRAGLYRDAAAAGPALEPRGAALGAGERAGAGGGDIPAHRLTVPDQLHARHYGATNTDLDTLRSSADAYLAGGETVESRTAIRWDETDGRKGGGPAVRPRVRSLQVRQMLASGAQDCRSGHATVDE